MNVSHPSQPLATRPAKKVQLPEPDVNYPGGNHNGHRVHVSPAAEPRKPAGYGLPCASCHLYYPADLEICP
jgi:hypothetical protein